MSWWALGGLVFAMTFFTVVAALQWIENRYFPVVTDFRIVSQTKVGNTLQIYGELTKERESCRFIEVSAYSGKSYLNLAFADSTGSMVGRSRAAGVQDWGPWIISPYHDEIRLVARHRCHFLWDTTTVLIDQ